MKIVRTAEQLARATGEPVSVVTDDRDAHWRFSRHGVERVAYPPRVRAAEEWPGVPRAGRWAEAACARLGYPPDELFLYRPLLDPAWWGRAVSVGLTERIDVFQAEFPGYAAAALVAARAIAATGRPRPRVSLVQHNVEWDRLRAFGHDVRWIARVEQALCRAVDDVVAVSVADRARLVAAGVDGAKVAVIPHGVDLAAFRAARPVGVRARYGIAADAPLLFFHGTLHYWPNTEAVRTIAEALLPRLLAAQPDLRVLIVGQGPPTYYAHPAIVYTGAVDDLPAHIAAADLCLCPVDSGGGTRMKLLEYLAAGKPVVTTTKGAEGIPFTPGDHMAVADGPAAFADAVLALLADRPAAARLGAAGAQFAARYDWAAVTERYVALYNGEGRGADHTPHLRPAPAPIDAHLPPHSPSKPRTLLLLVNRGCNLRCAFCDLWEGHVHMPVDRAIALLDDAVAIGTEVLVLTGGEPFLHPGLFEIVRAARARGLAVNITTNGTRIDARWDELRGAGVTSLSFSLDGLEATHDRLRGQKGSFRRTLAGLERVAALGTIATSVYFTVTRENVHEILPVRALARAHGAAFDFWPVNDAPTLALRPGPEAEALRDAVRQIGAEDAEIAARAGWFERGLAYHAEGSGGTSRCLGLIDQYGVTYEGDLLPCCVWGAPGVKVGNVFETPLRELWTSPEVQRARERLFHDGCTAGCFNHSLNEFERATGLSSRLDAPGPAPLGPPPAAPAG